MGELGGELCEPNITFKDCIYS